MAPSDVMERTSGEGSSRRAFCAKLGAAGVTAWSTPTVVSVAAAAAQSGPATTTPAAPMTVYEAAVVAMVDALDPASHDDADTVANCLHALALVGGSTATTSSRLWDLRETWAGHAGWGLTVPFDAFGDGSENPTDTIYGYTTARAGLAFRAAGDTARAVEAAATLASPILWDGSGVDYSDQPADRDKRVWNIDGLALWLWADLDVYPSARAVVQTNIEAAQGDGASVPAWHWPYQDGVDSTNDCHHLAFILRGLQAVGSSSLAYARENFHRFHAGSGKTKQHSTHQSAVTSGRDPGWHCAVATWLNRSWAGDVADDLVSSVTDGATSYRRDDGVHGDRDQAHTAFGLAVYAASVS